MEQMAQDTAGMPLAKEEVEVLIRTADSEIEAVAHFFAGARVTDYLNRPDISFLPLTSVSVRNLHSGDPQTYPFLALNKQSIVYLAPVQV